MSGVGVRWERGAHGRSGRKGMGLNGRLWRVGRGVQDVRNRLILRRRRPRAGGKDYEEALY